MRASCVRGETDLDFIQVIVLAIVQGFTEFLPISSSAHLILVPRLFGWPDQGLAFDVAVHVGTLSAVVWYFRRDLLSMTRDWVASVARRETVGDSRLAWGVILGTIPVGLAGLLLGDLIEAQLRSPLVIAATTIGFGLALWWADAAGAKSRTEHSLSWRDVLIIGCAQALALVPGTSRSGITMTAALALGLDRSGAARFSFLLSIPVIVLAGGLKLSSLLGQAHSVDWQALLLGSVLSALSAYICIDWFLKLMQRIGMMPFIVYRLALGVLLLVVFF
jgi:undecaprenyl-diphosphatase